MLDALLITVAVFGLLLGQRRRWADRNIDVGVGLLAYGAFLGFVLSAFAVDAFAVTGGAAVLAAGLVTGIVQLALVRTATAWAYPTPTARTWGSVDLPLDLLVFALLVARPTFLLTPTWSGVFVLELLLVVATCVLTFAPGWTRTVRTGQHRIYLPAAGLSAAAIALATTSLAAVAA